jgi:hypothetical protein
MTGAGLLLAILAAVSTPPVWVMLWLTVRDWYARVSKRGER